MPRKRHVSRNYAVCINGIAEHVMPRKRHVSRNGERNACIEWLVVMPRKRHVSRNSKKLLFPLLYLSHASQEACE